MNGWIKLSRRITDNPIYFGERFTRMHCLLDLMILAEWKEKRNFFVRTVKIELKRGQLAVPIRELADRWSMTQLTVLKRLNELEEVGLISINRSNTINVITINESLFDCNSESDLDSAELINESAGYAQTEAQTEAQTKTQTEAQTKALTLRNNNINNKNKNSLSACARKEGDAGDDFLRAFFAEERRASIEQLSVCWHLTAVQLKALAGECVMEWKLTGEKFADDFQTLARRLLQHMRAKQKYTRENGIEIPGAPRGTVEIVEVEGRSVYLGYEERIDADSNRTYSRFGPKVPLEAPPRPGKGWWWQPLTNSWCDLP